MIQRQAFKKDSKSSYQLSEQIKQIISRRVGIPFEQLINMDLKEIEDYIQKKNERKLVYSETARIDGIPLDKDHIITREEVDRRIDAMTGSILSSKRKVKTIFK